MTRFPTARFLALAIALGISAIASSGCCLCSALCPGVRIDPTGESLVLGPGQTQPYAVPSYVTPPSPVIKGPPAAMVPVAPVAVAPAGAPVVVAPTSQPFSNPSMVPSTPFGNVVAPPVLSDPTSGPVSAPLVASVPPPPVMAPVAVVPAAAPGMPLPPPPNMAPMQVLPTSALIPCGVEHLQVVPTSLIAPVGSEMLLKASVPFSDGTLRINRRVDWFINAGSAGAFTEMGLRDRGQLVGFLETPQKIDDYTATSSLAVVPITLNTATPDPNDDIPIQRGEAWVTLSSATEGTTVVTAQAPWLDQFSTAITTIHWIDAQWVFTQTTSAEAGRPYTLTTTVMRRSDGAPLPGWTVRYNVSGAAAGLGYEGGSAVESTTDAAGRASVEVSPKDAAGGVTNVGITIIRPATGGPVPIPRLELGRAASTINWAATCVPVGPLPSGPPTAPIMPGVPVPMGPPAGPPPSLPTGPPIAEQPPASPPPAAPSSPYSPAPAAAVGKPQLEVTLGAASPSQVAVGQEVSFDVTIVNRGDGVARNVRLGDDFDRGLRHPKAAAGVYHVDLIGGIPDLAPNQSYSIPMTFLVADGGMQCHEVSVTADGLATPVKQRGCVTAQQGALTLDVVATKQQVVGDVTKVNVVLKNIGDVPVTGIELVTQFDPAMSVNGADPASSLLTDGSILLKVDRLEAGEKRTFPFSALCRSPSLNARITARAEAKNITSPAAQGTIEIKPQLGGATPGAAAPATASDLRLSVTTPTNPGRMNQRQQLTVTIQNLGQQTERNVNVRVQIPAEFTPDLAGIQPLGEATAAAPYIQFAAIAELAPGQQKQYVVPVTPNRTGKVQATAQVVSEAVTTPKTVNSDLIDILGQ